MIKCTRCGEEKPPDNFTKDSKRKTGKFAWCKACVKEIIDHRKNSFVPLDELPEFQTCNRCKVNQPLDTEHFNINRSRIHGFEYECKLCRRSRRNAAYAANPKKEHAWMDIRRARERTNGPYEVILYDIVWETSKGVCGICNQPVDKAIKSPDGNSGSIDHIIPISKGGLHLYENVQLAHRSCNLTKSDRLDYKP